MAKLGTTDVPEILVGRDDAMIAALEFLSNKDPDEYTDQDDLLRHMILATGRTKGNCIDPLSTIHTLRCIEPYMVVDHNGRNAGPAKMFRITPLGRRALQRAYGKPVTPEAPAKVADEPTPAATAPEPKGRVTPKQVSQKRAARTAG